MYLPSNPDIRIKIERIITPIIFKILRILPILSHKVA
jgi:hypothetical protein